MTPTEREAIRERDAWVDVSPLWKGWETGHPKIAELIRDRRVLLAALTEAEAERDRLRKALADVYSDRNLLAQAFAQAMETLDWPVWWGEDPSEPDWPVLYIETTQGQVSWHIPKAERVYEPPPRTGYPQPWDGHTVEAKLDRLRAALRGEGG